MSEREAFEAEYSKGDFGIAGCDLSKHADGSYINDDAFSAFFWFKAGLAHANVKEQSQAQQPTEVKPYGYVTTLRNGTKHFYESMPYLDNAVKCDTVYLQSQAQQESQWMPIETAPKDRSVMLYTNKVLPVYVGRKRYGNLGEPQQDACEWRCDSSGRYSTPKFWMPIPPAPEGE